MENEEKIAVAFNGGKESLVVLHIYLFGPTPRSNLCIFRVQHSNGHEFPEILRYITEMEQRWNFKTLVYDDMISAIEDLKKKGCVKFALGNRMTDPNSSKLQYETPTDEGWPSAIRVFPILTWSYKHVWAYINENELPVCSLYENGYTSIGRVGNTFPNNELFVRDTCKYLHARELKDESSERSGRIKCNLPIKFSGTVVRGHGNGKKLGFATANLKLHPGLDANLQDGVYYGTCSRIEQETGHPITAYMVMSVGSNPSVEILGTDGLEKTYEVHIIKPSSFNSSDLEDRLWPDFYSTELHVFVTGFIRSMSKYNSLISLIEAIETDIAVLRHSIK